MKYYKILVVILLLGIFSSCSKKFDRLLINPNGPSVEQADVDAFLNQAQLSLQQFYAGTSVVTVGASDITYAQSIGFGVKLVSSGKLGA